MVAGNKNGEKGTGEIEENSLCHSSGKFMNSTHIGLDWKCGLWVRPEQEDGDLQEGVEES